jgi:hypothetical protein
LQNELIEPVAQTKKSHSCDEREALMRSEPSESSADDQNCSAATAKFFTDGLRRAFVRQARSMFDTSASFAGVESRASREIRRGLILAGHTRLAGYAEERGWLDAITDEGSSGDPNASPLWIALVVDGRCRTDRSTAVPLVKVDGIRGGL